MDCKFLCTLLMASTIILFEIHTNHFKMTNLQLQKQTVHESNSSKIPLRKGISSILFLKIKIDCKKLSALSPFALSTMRYFFMFLKS